MTLKSTMMCELRCAGWWRRVALFALGSLLVTAANAQKASLEVIAQYAGPDRTARLLAGAKKEGPLSLYTSGQSDDIGALAAAFEKKYGLKVTMWRASSEKVLQRVVTEARGNRFTVDVIETNGPEMEALHREKLIHAVKSPHIADIISAAIMPHGEWVGTRLNVFVQAYNTNLVKKDDLPKRWEDLTDPKWKGRLGIEAEDMDWLAGVLGEVGEARGIQTFKEIVAKNGISVRRGHTLLAQLVASGEIPFAFTVYNYKAEQLKAKGAPIEWISIGTAIARPNGVAVSRRSPNPHTAVLFFDYELSEEGQRVLAQRDFVPTNRKVASTLNAMPLKVVDPRVTLDEYAKWGKLYEELFTKVAKR